MGTPGLNSAETVDDEGAEVPVTLL
jgi:hypothetical protein